MKTTHSILCAVLFFGIVGTGAHAAYATPAKTETAIEAQSSEKRFSDYVQLSPMLGFTAINSSAGFNVGSAAAMRVLESAPLYFEPSLFLTAYSSRVQFHFGVGGRYDINLPDTKVKPLVRASLGPTFQTSGTVAVFNAFFGAGAMIPVSSKLDFRAEAGLVNVDGNAGFQLLTGIAL